MRFFSSVYVLLLVYTIAALVFWGISLEKQNKRIYEQELLILSQDVDSAQHPALYSNRLNELKRKHHMRKSQYVGEGATFFIVILVGAAVVWTSIRSSLRLSKQQNNFMLSVTHELKSPIAAMKLNLQTLEKYQLDDDKRNLLIERCIRESNRLNDLCNNMLFASQIEGRQYKSTRELINFSNLVTRSVKDYEHRYPGRFAASITPGIQMNGDQVMLQMAINNLLENGIKYTPADQPIRVTLNLLQRTVMLQVMDTGAGISDDEKKKIFNKFYRIGNEENRMAKGTGLGLYLTSKIVKQHGGKIAVKDNEPHGAIFEICLEAA